MAAPYYGMIEEVCVMLVDNDKEFITKMADLLKSRDYKVIIVDTTSAAMSMLSKGKQKIDVMILHAHSTNLLSFDLLAQAVTLDIISLVVCDEFNESAAKKTLEDGAYLYLEQPFEMEIVKYLWQFVLREKMRREKKSEGSRKNGERMKIDDIGNNNIVGEDEQSREKKNVSNLEEQSNNIHEAENDIVLNGKYKPRGKRGRKSMKEINKGKSKNNVINKVIRRKEYTEWTEDLHAIFMNAVRELGEGRCYPKDIHELMNSPGLTRNQVASHLQKCRRNNWRSPKERKNIRHRLGQRSSSVSHEPRSKFRKFGTMPCLQANAQNQQRNQDQIQRDPGFPFPTLTINNNFVRGESSTQEQLYRPQLQVLPHYLNIDNPFHNPFLSTQPNVGVGQLQQHGPLFGISGSQGLQNSTIRNINYRPGLALNRGDHRALKDYNFDLNVFQGATYPGSRIVSGIYMGNATINDTNLNNANVDNVTTYLNSAMMSGVYAGNVTINGLGATNANFQQYVGEQNMFDPRTVVAASYENYVEGNKSNEKETCNMDYIFQNLGPPGANLPNEQDIGFDQVYSDDQARGRELEHSISRTENHSDESSI